VASLRGALEPAIGLGIVTGPPRCGGSTTLACLARDAATRERRLLRLEPGAGRGVGDALAAAAQQCADVVVLDGLPAEALAAALAPASVGRLLLVRTDATEIFSLPEERGG